MLNYVIIFGCCFVAIFFSRWFICKFIVKADFLKLAPKLEINGYEIFYADKKMNDKNVICGKILKSTKYNLLGKPDYILKHKTKNIYVPVELKSGKIGEKLVPNANDLIQLSAYLVIIEELFGVRPAQGRLIYSDYMFIVKNTPKLEISVIETLEEMRMMLKSGKGLADPSFLKCKNCQCRDIVCQICK